MAQTGPVGPPLSETPNAVRSAALAEALRHSDEVYVVHYELESDDVRVFGHREDADAFALAVWGAPAAPANVIATSVCDHADARRLIEQEEG